jgi:hypothetical protein
MCVIKFVDDLSSGLGEISIFENGTQVGRRFAGIEHEAFNLARQDVPLTGKRVDGVDVVEFAFLVTLVLFFEKL